MMALGNRNDLDGVDMQDTVHEDVLPLFML